MQIEIKCRNFSNFDPASGKYVQCGEKIIVSNDKIGQFVSCSKCSQPVEVVALSEAETLERAKRRSRGSKAGSKQNPSSKSASSQPQPSRSKHAQPSNSAPAPAADELRMAAPLKRDKSDVMALDFGDQQIESTLGEDQHDRCSKCGNVSNSGKCTVCRHVEPNFEKRTQPINDVEIELVGFQRWFCKTMSEGVSVKFLEYGAHFGLGFIAAGTTLLSLMSICGLAFGVVPGLMLFFLTFCAAVLYISFVLKGKQFRNDPHAKLAWFQKPFWNGLLVLARAMNWQNYDSNLKGRRIIKIRDGKFGDVELAGTPGLKNCQVLDLEGTNVTDAGIRLLYGHKHLQCLIIKGTNTTHETVFRFQQSHPKLWIWE